MNMLFPEGLQEPLAQGGELVLTRLPFVPVSASCSEKTATCRLELHVWMQGLCLSGAVRDGMRGAPGTPKPLTCRWRAALGTPAIGQCLLA